MSRTRSMPGIRGVSPSISPAFLIFLFHIVSPSVGFAQWQPDQRLTNDTASSVYLTNTSWSIAASGDTVHVVWRDSRDNNNEIYYKRSTDGGIHWEVDVRLTNDTANSSTPCVAVLGTITHVAWNDFRDGNSEIYYKRSTDGGESWGSDTRLTNGAFWAGTACLAVSASMVHLVWRDSRGGSSADDYKIYYKRSTDEGMHWGADTALPTGMQAFNPSLAVSGRFVHVVWNEKQNERMGIHYLRSTNDGESWGNQIRLFSSVAAQLPSVAVSGSDVHVVWDDYRDGNSEIYHIRSTDDGMQWESETRLSDQADPSMWPSVCRSGSNVHIVWQDERNGTPEIYYIRSTDGGATWEAQTRLTDNFSTSSERPTVAAAKDAVHVVWMDRRDSPNGEIYYKRNPTGNAAGGTGIADRTPETLFHLRNHPNPYRETTTIEYSLARSGWVRLTVHDLLGRVVATVVDAWQPAGSRAIPFVAAKLPAGIYACRIESDGCQSNRPMVLLK
jgi:hypothetical protein